MKSLPPIFHEQAAAAAEHCSLLSSDEDADVNH